MRSGTYQVRRAYAVLGLQFGAPPGQVRRRYKVLVRRWHPDRYANDPAGQAAAAHQMREINAAYRLVTRQLPPGKTPVGAAPPAASHVRVRGRLSREEIESLVRAIGSDSPFDTLLKVMGWVGGSVEGLFVPLLVAASVLRIAMVASAGDMGRLLTDPGLLLFLGLLILLLIGEYLERRKLEGGR